MYSEKYYLIRIVFIKNNMSMKSQTFRPLKFNELTNGLKY